MFYESIVHQVKEVGSAREAAILIKEGNESSCNALSWETKNGRFYAVSDAHIDDYSFAEVAIIKKENDFFIQKESITAAWVNSVDKLEKYFVDAETSDFSIKTSLILGKPTTETAFFTCGCCGERFRDNVAKQLKFDQDNGYGICKRCENWYC